MVSRRRGSEVYLLSRTGKIHPLTTRTSDAYVDGHTSLKKTFRETRLFPWQGVWSGFLVGVLR